MDANDLESFLADEATHAEEHKDAAEAPGTTAKRPGGSRGRVFSIRVSEAEARALESVARREGIPPSTLARAWITERLAANDGLTDVHSIAEALATFSRRLAAY